MTDTSDRGRELWHRDRIREQTPSGGDGRLVAAMTDHLESHFGMDFQVWHEIESDGVHVDVFHVTPSAERAYHLLMTCGMSERPMTVPFGEGASPYAELVLALPGNWPMTMEAFRDEANYWPVRLLKVLARFPHLYGTWLGPGHTHATADPPEAFGPGTELSSALLLPSTVLPDGFNPLRIGWRKKVTFLAVVALHTSELHYVLEHGLEALLEKLEEVGVTELLDIRRAPAVGPTWGSIS